MTENLGSGTAKGLVDYLDSLVEKGRSRPGVVTPLKTALTKVLEKTEGEDWEKVDVIKLDVEDAISRFKNLTLTTYTDASYRAYELRTKRAIKWYENFLANPGWYPKESGRAVKTEASPTKIGKSVQGKSEQISSKKNSESEKAIVTEAVRESVVPKIDAIAYPFPLANGETARVYMPKGVTKQDIKRLSAFLDALVIEENDTDA